MCLRKACLFLKLKKLHSIHGKETCSKIQFASENTDLSNVYSSKKEKSAWSLEEFFESTFLTKFQKIPNISKISKPGFFMK